MISNLAYFCKTESFLELSEKDQIVYTTGLMDGFLAMEVFGARGATAKRLQECTADMDRGDHREVRERPS